MDNNKKILSLRDIVKDPWASIVNLSMTMVVDGDLVKVVSW